MAADTLNGKGKLHNFADYRKVVPPPPDEGREVPLRAAAFADEDGETVLGMLLAGGRTALDQAGASGLRRQDFYREAHKAVYDAINAEPESRPVFLVENLLDHMERDGRLPPSERPLCHDLETWRDRPVSQTVELLPGYVERLHKARQERVLSQYLTRMGERLAGGDVAAALGLLDEAKGRADLYCLVSRGETIRQDNTIISPGKLPFAPMSKALAEANEAADPVATGMLYAGALSGMSAREKIGKTTLLFALFKALETGEPFLGLPTRAASVVFLTEENADTIAEKQELWGIGDHVHVLYRHQADGVPFAEVMQQARDYARKVGAAGIVVDTFFEWSDLTGEEENHSGAVKEAVRAAKAIVADGALFVFLICHDSKSGPWRGSTVLPAMLDVKLELRVPAGEDADTTNKRILTGKGRYRDIPRALLCELEGQTYRRLGEPAPRERTERSRVVTAVAQLGEATWEPVAQKLGLSKPQTLALLRTAVRAGELSCTGRGVRNDPMVFRALAPSGSRPDGLVLSCPAPLGKEAGNTTAVGAA